MLPLHHAQWNSVDRPTCCPCKDACAYCHAGEVCTPQESSLQLLWTLGIFTLNCGPVVMGFVLDFLGPKLTGILGRPGGRGLLEGRSAFVHAQHNVLT